MSVRALLVQNHSLHRGKPGGGESNSPVRPGQPETVCADAVSRSVGVAVPAAPKRGGTVVRAAPHDAREAFIDVETVLKILNRLASHAGLVRPATFLTPLPGVTVHVEKPEVVRALLPDRPGVAVAVAEI